MSFYSVRNPDEKPVLDIFSGVQSDRACLCGCALEHHGQFKYANLRYCPICKRYCNGPLSKQALQFLEGE